MYLRIFGELIEELQNIPIGLNYSRLQSAAFPLNECDNPSLMPFISYPEDQPRHSSSTGHLNPVFPITTATSIFIYAELDLWLCLSFKYICFCEHYSNLPAPPS